MRNNFVKSAVFSAAGMMVFGAFSPVCAAEAGTETQFKEEIIYNNVDASGKPVWKIDLCAGRIPAEWIQPNRYYICRAGPVIYCPAMSADRHTTYKLIKVEYLFKQGQDIMAYYTDAETGQSDVINLESVRLYEIPAFKCITAIY